LSSIAEKVLTKGTTLNVEVVLVVVVELQLVDARLVELDEVVDDELELLEVVELVFDVVEVEEEEEAEDKLEVEEPVTIEVVEEVDFGAERSAYAPTPAIATITTTIKAIARGASAPLF
jgi:L-fucose mutarotase/ribose pyranase (RbsD/FucU family)